MRILDVLPEYHSGVRNSQTHEYTDYFADSILTDFYAGGLTGGKSVTGIYRDALQPDAQACEERDAVARRVQTTAENEVRRRLGNSGLFKHWGTLRCL